MLESPYRIFPLFASPVAVFNVTEDLTFFSEAAPKWKFEYLGAHVKYSTQTKDTHILNSFPEAKSILLKYFYDFKNEVLGLGNQDFAITTSWGTKTEPGGASTPHLHLNSSFSGVLYFDEVGGGDLEFINYSGNFSSFFLNVSNNGIFNSPTFTLKPRKNMLVLFPSHLQHRITENTSSSTRYSLAFNLFPIGSFGQADSFVTISIDGI